MLPVDEIRRRLLPNLKLPEVHGLQGLQPVEKAEVAESAKAKADTKRTPDGLPVHSFTTLLSDLATLTLNEVTLPGSPDHAFPLMAKPTELQSRAFELLDIDPAKDVAM